jgi:hypothetical protein
MAETTPSRSRGISATGKNAHLSTRRRALALGAMGAAALALPAVACATEPDAQFWAMHREWKARREEWEASGGHWADWQKSGRALSIRLLNCPVSTAAAMLAKIEVDFVSEGIELPLQVYADAQRIDGRRAAA